MIGGACLSTANCNIMSTCSTETFCFKRGAFKINTSAEMDKSEEGVWITAGEMMGC